MSKPKRRRKSMRFVPRVVVGVSLACVVPACAMGLAGCNYTSVAADAFSVADVSHDVRRDAGPTVAADAWGVADVSFDVGPAVAVDAFGVADTGFSVADSGFHGVAADAFGVADTGFGPG